MIRLLDTQPRVAVADAEYLRLLGYPPGHVPGDRVRELMAWARSWYAAHGRPWVLLREATPGMEDGVLRIDGREFRSVRLRDHLRGSGASRVVLVAVSAGRACEEEALRLWQDSRPDEYFFLEVLGSVVVEHLVASVSGRICESADAVGLRAVPHYSPGYAGWDVAEQGMLFDLFAEGSDAGFPEPMSVLASGMLRPKKSLLAVVGLASRPVAGRDVSESTPCERCSFAPCRYRRVTYKHATVRIDGAPEPAPAVEPRYTVNPRALRKWARERVALQTRGDGALVATFRFDGTTCSNLGHPLTFDYRVVLGRSDEGNTILEAECRPAEGDAGHARMCAYLADPGRLLGVIASEKPLLGRPLAAVLAWQREPSPSGCFCDASGRAHKWGIALEVIHHAVAQAGANLTASDPVSMPR